MPANPLYENQLRDLLTNPDGFAGTPGYQFARDQGLQAARRGMSSQRGSGNVLAELTRLGSGYASQDYGNQRDFLGRMTGQEQQFGLGQEQNRLTGVRDANQFTLGREQNANTRRAGDQTFGLGLYRAGNDAQRNAWDYELGQGQNQNNWRNANTNWFNAQSQDRQRRGQTNQGWWDRLGG